MLFTHTTVEGPDGELVKVKRTGLSPYQLPIDRLIQKRAAYCLQGWWSNLKFKKRMQSLLNIKKHVYQIKNKEIYIEQTLYNNIEKVVSTAAHGFRFVEQSILFDFNKWKGDYSICMQVEENPYVPDPDYHGLFDAHGV